MQAVCLCGTATHPADALELLFSLHACESQHYSSDCLFTEEPAPIKHDAAAIEFLAAKENGSFRL